MWKFGYFIFYNYENLYIFEIVTYCGRHTIVIGKLQKHFHISIMKNIHFFFLKIGKFINFKKINSGPVLMKIKIIVVVPGVRINFPEVTLKSSGVKQISFFGQFQVFIKYIIYNTILHSQNILVFFLLFYLVHEKKTGVALFFLKL